MLHELNFIKSKLIKELSKYDNDYYKETILNAYFAIEYSYKYIPTSHNIIYIIINKNKNNIIKLITDFNYYFNMIIAPKYKIHYINKVDENTITNMNKIQQEYYKLLLKYEKNEKLIES